MIDKYGDCEQRRQDKQLEKMDQDMPQIDGS